MGFFREKDTQRIWDREHVRRFDPDVQRSLKPRARLDAAESLDDLRAFGSRLEKLRGDRDGQRPAGQASREERQMSMSPSWAKRSISASSSSVKSSRSRAATLASN